MPPKRKAAESVDAGSTADGVLHFLRCQENSSDKFYELSLAGNRVISRYGRSGSQGVSVFKDFDDRSAALAFVASTLAEKLKKGYTEGSAAPSTSTKAKSPVAVAAPAAGAAKAQKVTKQAVTSSAGAASIASETKYLECVEGTSSKFYEITRNGDTVTIRYGRIGTDGSTSDKDFGGSVPEAVKFMTKTVAEKVKKGYVEATANANAAQAATKGKASAVAAAPAATKAAKAPKEAPKAGKAVATTSAAATTQSATVYLECVEGTSSKFYEITRKGDTVTIRYGRIGTDGVKSDKEFGGNVAAAVKFVTKTVAEKEKKGYVQTAPAGGVTDGPTTVASHLLFCGHPLRPDRATVHLFSQAEKEDGSEDDEGDGDGSDGDGSEDAGSEGDDDDDGSGDEGSDDEGPAIYKLNKKDFAKLRPYLRRGDLLENVAVSGYRSQGMYIFDGVNVTHMGDDLDDYGNIPAEYVVYKEFNPHYWEIGQLNVNNILVPESQGYKVSWHGGDYPCVYVYAPAIRDADGLTIHFQGQDYEIEDYFKEWIEEEPDEGEVGEYQYVSTCLDEVRVGVTYE